MQFHENAVYRHIKTGNLYQLIATAKMMVDEGNVAVYRRLGTCNQNWVRSMSQFTDKFELVDADEIQLKEIKP